MVDPSSLASLSFQTPLERARQLVLQVANRFQGSPPATILDVGCGNGAQTLALLEVFPQATAVGIDLSPLSIESAKALQTQSPAGARASFISGDYLETELGQFDLILSDGTLHLIPGQTEALFKKLVSELSPNGHLVFSMPYRCVYNTLLAGVRRVFRICQGRYTDRLILKVAERMHAHEMPRDLLQERISYMYLLPQRYVDRRLKSLLARRFHLSPEQPLKYRHASPGQFKHTLEVFRKAA